MKSRSPSPFTMALSADQTTAMNSMANLLAQQHVPAKDMELVTNALVAGWGLSAADAKTLRKGVHQGHGSFGDTT